MHCDKCRAQNDVRALKLPSHCRDCSVPTARGDTLCPSCSRDTVRCQYCRSHSVSSSGMPGSTPMPSSGPAELQPMPRLHLLQALFDHYGKDGRMTDLDFRNLYKQFSHLDRPRCRSLVDIAFQQVSGRRGASIGFEQFVDVCDRASVIMFGKHENTDDLMFDTELVPLLARIRSQKGPKRVGNIPREAADVLSSNERMIRRVYEQACRHDRNLAVESFMAFCRKAGILPERRTFAQLSEIFEQCHKATSSTTGASMAEFTAMLAAIADNDPIQLHLLLLRMSDHYYVSFDRIEGEIRVPDSPPSSPGPSTPRKKWRAALAAIFDKYCRLGDTGGKATARMSLSMALRFMADYNSVADQRIVRRDFTSALWKAQSDLNHSRNCIRRDTFILAMTDHAAQVADANGKPLHDVLADIEASLDKCQQRLEGAVPDPQPNPLLEDEVCSILLENEPHLLELYKKFAAHSQPHQVGLRLTQNDFERLCVAYHIIPNLLTARQLAWICRDVRAGRETDTGGPLDTDEFMEAIARISSAAFASGVVLGRRCKKRSAGDRLLLLLAFIDERHGGGILPRDFDALGLLPKSESDRAAEQTRKARARRLQKLERDMCGSATPPGPHPPAPQPLPE